MGSNSNLKYYGKCAAGGVLALGGITVALPLLGFGGAGIGAATVASGVQSMIGNVAAGSVFASLQSAGVAGLAGGTKMAIGAGGAYATGYLQNKKIL